VPRLWDKTIEMHRHQVREAILDSTATLASEHGLGLVTMSQIANATGIGRATLDKFFPDVESIVCAWHEGHIAEHLARLAEVRSRTGGPRARLEAVMQTYARIAYYRGRHGIRDLGPVPHPGHRVTRAQQQLQALFQDLLTEVGVSGTLREDVSPDELASYCLYALSAAGRLQSEDAVRRLVAVTLDGLRPRR